mmetsp:Transcript_49961/g.150249  ORF Transcript_49961/g.150249 Transcript_49961/m.150249 type:complete len:112 (-) Transcript_49961:432-767(-)
MHQKEQRNAIFNLVCLHVIIAILVWWFQHTKVIITYHFITGGIAFTTLCRAKKPTLLPHPSSPHKRNPATCKLQWNYHVGCLILPNDSPKRNGMEWHLNTQAGSMVALYCC